MSEEQNARSDARQRIIIRTSLIGILTNVLLAGFKAAVGLLSRSIAVVLDAVNNLSDALSSLITIVGTRLGSRAPDRKHPLGHGRAEYLTALAVAALVLYAGITSMVESVRKIVRPEPADYSVPMLIIIAAAVVVKVLLGTYVRRKGTEARSDALKASGSDALFDALVSTSVLLSAVIFLTTGISLEAYVGVLIAVLILKAGYEMLTDTLDDILGKRTDPELAEAIRRTICEPPEVYGAYDLILHSYGPERTVGSVHIEVDDTMTADRLDQLERDIAARVYNVHGIALTGIGIYARNTRDDAVAEIRTRVTGIVMRHEGVLQMHGFYASPAEKRLQLDLILDFAVEDRPALFARIRQELQDAYPGYTVVMTMDLDF